MESAEDWHLARALLEWQLDMGVDECIGDTPVDRFVASQAARAPRPAAPAAPAVIRHELDPVEVAQAAAQGASTLEELRAAITAYEHCELRQGARHTVFCDGLPGAKVMILGEAPGRDEDREGRPFVGRAGQLLDRMFAAIGLSRDGETPDNAFYITNVMPWRPPQNRDPRPEEIAMMLPFVQRHIALARPEVLILMGNISCQAALNKRGILKLRGHWTKAFGIPALPMTHPAYLLRQPHAKREAWSDLLEIRAHLDGLG
ncbi:uracil-DNA glycosylase [Pseudooceanicola sp. CBS1P-1]|uniref:Type-4 uracil-DNA glycosylase n=1 Tax=Pseudooceanicola albus TaxID=2692189 RepID=A0A6L7G3Q6_9RHOB|nr:MULTISPECIES: uracil-DNA glycosylase [Pseudooceanicola]MBT9384858.1 uracil-DNA glycosylase [Pseudooceanicola endophyticus]MXN18148.1 uracil-DNA glycosylase [Pseudooceanicola albus]